MKLDFICGLLHKALHCTGGDDARGNQALLGEAIAWRNLFWSLSNAMAHNPDPWKGDAALPQLHAGLAYRVFAPDAYPRIKVMKLLWDAIGTEGDPGFILKPDLDPRAGNAGEQVVLQQASQALSKDLLCFSILLWMKRARLQPGKA